MANGCLVFSEVLVLTLFLLLSYGWLFFLYLLSHAWRLNFCKVELETYNSHIVETLLGHYMALNSNALVLDLKALIGRRWEVWVTHIL
ncbi:hypothetical protein GQ457_03G009730 [Hibiscus cannabinus]